MTPRLVVAAAVVDDLDAPTVLLAARRSKPLNLSGRWEFPGGKVDPGETPEQALHRELSEELGVEVRLGREVPSPDGRPWVLSARHVMRVWLAAVTRGVPEPLVEHDELRWLPLGDWLSVDWLDGDVPIIQALTALVEPVAQEPFASA